MKKVLIVGASSKTSIGYHVGEYLREHGYEAVYASRSGKLGIKCDLKNPSQVKKMLAAEKPEIVIHAAGVFCPPQVLGEIDQWSEVFAHIDAKSSGALVLANALIVVGTVHTFIALGGRETSSEPDFAMYTISNGALWGLIRFMATHTKINSYFLDMPFITSSTMNKAYQETTGKRPLGENMNVVFFTIEEILNGKYENGKRILLGQKEIG